MPSIQPNILDILDGGVDRTDFFHNFHNWPKMLENQNNWKILFHSTIPAQAQCLQTWKSNSTWLILKLLNISAHHVFYLRDNNVLAKKKGSTQKILIKLLLVTDELLALEPFQR